MTAAALMVPPYNDFFKAGFSTAGNHDNNIYNNAWSERWHGLKEVPVDQKTDGAQVSSTAQVQQRSSPSDLRAVLDVEPEDFFNDFELASNESHLEFEKRLWGDTEPLPLWIQEEMLEQEKQVQQNEVTTQQEQTKVDETSKTDDKSKTDEGKVTEQKKEEQTTEGKKEDSKTEVTKTEDNKDGEKKEETKNEDTKNDETKKEGDGKSEVKTRFEITVPTNAELASNLKHHLFLVHGELDNNVHPANTLRLVDALIKANKKFDMLYLPATRHGFGRINPMSHRECSSFFADRLLTDYAEEKQPVPSK